MIERFDEPVAFFLLIMSVILVTPMLSERMRLPGIVGIILGGMLIGPNALGLIEADERIRFLAAIGLVYLMFSAGLEVDINQFMRVRGRALVFGILTFALPQMMGMALGLLLGLQPLGMVLLGSAFASHTLISFPILTRLGVTRNEAVAVTAGATVLTDIGAFIILAVVLGAEGGGLDPGFLPRLLLLLVLLGGLIMLGLPRLGKVFFSRFTSRSIEFQFVVVALFVAAFGAELIGVHEVVGAFLAGLAINATLPRHSAVSGHVLFIGESLLIPVFLLYSGMITDPLAFVRNTQTIWIALGVTFVAYVSKLVAAWLTSRIFHYRPAEFWTIFGLSHAQAAVTIPTLVIGLEEGLFDANLFNAAILMILVTSITSPLVVQKFGPGLPTESEDQPPLELFSRILVPVTDARAGQNLLTLASLLARTGSGKVMAVSVARSATGRDGSIVMRRDQLNRIPGVLDDPQVQLELIPRVEVTHAQGILHTAAERDATLIMMGWRGKRTLRENVLGSVLDEVIWGSDTPVMIGKLSQPLNGTVRVVLLIPHGVLAPIAIKRILDANLAMAGALNVPLQIRADPQYLQPLEALLARHGTEQKVTLETLGGVLRMEELEHESVGALISIAGYGSRERVVATLGNLPERLAGSSRGNVVILHFDR